MYMIIFMFLMHDIVVLSTCCAKMHGMSLYNVLLNDYSMKVLLGMNEVVYAFHVNV